MTPANPVSFSSIDDPERAAFSIQQIIDVHQAWFVSENGGAPIETRLREFEFYSSHGRLIFAAMTAHGARNWRITGWNWKDEKLSLQATRRMGADAAVIEMVPRASAKALMAGIAAARLARSERLAQLLARDLSGDESDSVPWTKVERAMVSPGMRRDQPGRYARIILRQTGERIAATGIVAQSDVRNVDALFSSALLWFTRLLATPKRPPLGRLLLVVEPNILKAAQQRHVLLRQWWRDRIELREIDAEWQQVKSVRPFERKHIWHRRLSRFPPVRDEETSTGAGGIIATAPTAIDAVASRHGQTLRYHGLPFARVRTVLGRERIWFGIEGTPRRVLDRFHERDWIKLNDDLTTYRNHACCDRHHWLYRASGEAWLESVLRRDIRKLDPGLIIAPIHAQFRTSYGPKSGVGGARPIDLLALRHDGRLVVIELKVSEDREHVFQGLDYWRRVEAHRRRGHISTAKLFGDREISDESPLVYLVAPTLRFHPSFATLAKTIAADIEIYRFDINEDWRAGVRVVRRERVNA